MSWQRRVPKYAKNRFLLLCSGYWSEWVVGLFQKRPYNILSPLPILCILCDLRTMCSGSSGSKWRPRGLGRRWPSCIKLLWPKMSPKGVSSNNLRLGLLIFVFYFTSKNLLYYQHLLVNTEQHSKKDLVCEQVEMI